MTADKKLGSLGKYRLVKELGQGGMGVVYEAIQDGLDRHVALKVLPTWLANDPDYVIRFQREAQEAARLSHHNIVTIFEVGNAQGIYFIAMELITGEDLQRRLQRQRKIPVPEAISLLTQAVDGLSHAWERQIVHRDIKPANLIVRTDGSLKILDFGLAKGAAAKATMTQSGAGMGTPHYMPPEQALNAKTVDLRADIYSLGATFYHLLSGQVPFPGDSPIEVAMKAATAPLSPIRSINPGVPESLAFVVERMMARQAEKRYGSAKGLLEALAGSGKPTTSRHRHLMDQPAAVMGLPEARSSVREAAHRFFKTNGVTWDHRGWLAFLNDVRFQVPVTFLTDAEVGALLEDEATAERMQRAKPHPINPLRPVISDNASEDHASRRVSVAVTEEEKAAVVRAIRAGQRFAEVGNGTVVDVKNNIMWLAKFQMIAEWSVTPDPKDWFEAQDTARKSTFPNFNNRAGTGYSYWRLPTILELKSLKDAVNFPAFVEVRNHDKGRVSVWSGEMAPKRFWHVDTGARKAACVELTSGVVEWLDGSTSKRLVLLVRG